MQYALGIPTKFVDEYIFFLYAFCCLLMSICYLRFSYPIYRKYLQISSSLQTSSAKKSANKIKYKINTYNFNYNNNVLLLNNNLCENKSELDDNNVQSLGDTVPDVQVHSDLFLES